MALTATQVQQFYIGYYGRPADPVGLTFWQTKTEAAALAGFATSAEFTNQFTGLSTSQQVTKVYGNLLGRTPDVAGLLYWAGEITAGRETIGSLVLSMTKNALGKDVTTIADRVTYSTAFTAALNTTEEVNAYAGAAATQAARDALLKVISTSVGDHAALTTELTKVDATIATIVSGGSTNPGQTFTLTENTDTATANVFNAGMVYTPGGDDRINSLQDEDTLTGTGTNPTLNATLGNANDNGATTVTPKLAGVKTINVAFAGSGGAAVTQLDLQDATGVDNAINITRISDGLVAAGATIDNISSIPVDLSVANSGQPTQDITFGFKNSAVSGNADSINVTISDVQARNLAVQSRLPTAGLGIETINLVSSGSANSLAQLRIEDAETLNISGEEDLTLQGTANVVNAGIVEAVTYTAGLGNVAGSLSLVDASGLEGNLVIALGAETVATRDNTSGQQVNFVLKGAAGNDNVVLINGMNTGDSLDLGLGANNLTVLATTQTGAVINAQTLTVLNQAAVANTIGVDAGVFTGLNSVVVRNEGNNGVGSSAAAPMTTNLLNLAATPASDITVKHGTTGNNGLVQNILNVDVAAGVSAVTVKLADATNANPRFNLNLTTDSDLTLNAVGAIASGNNNAPGANAVTTLNLVDGDSESNSILLSAQGYTAAGALRADRGTSYTTVNVSKGDASQAGKFLNLDTTLNAYGLNTNGAVGNASSGLAAAGNRDTVFANTYANTQYSVDATGANIGYVATGAAANAVGERLIATTVNAGAFDGDFIVRVGQADQSITTSTGNDTVIFDAINDARAGLTISDRVAMGAGVDTIVIDGGMTIGAAQINLGASEWTNLSGVDVLRLGTNDLNGGIASTYSLVVTDQLVGQTDAGNRITIINNDGNLTAVGTSNATVDMRQSNGLSATKFVNFYGENGDTVTVGNAVANAANRVILSDATANGGHILNGGDRDLNTFATAAAWNGAAAANRHNGNTLEYRSTSVVTAGDQVGISNFANVVFNNDQAIAQTLTLELTTAVADALADASHVAASAAQETLNVRANDASFASTAGAALNIEGRSVSNAFIMNIRTDDNNGANNRDVIDTINLNDNVGGSAGHTVDIADGGTVADVLTFFGATGDAWSAATTVISVAGTTNTGTVTIQNTTGLATAVQTLSWDNADTIRLTQDNGASFTTLQAGTSALNFNGSAIADTIFGTAGANIITGNAGADIITTGLGNDTVTLNSFATTDTITDFAAGDILNVDVVNPAANTYYEGPAFFASTTDEIVILTNAGGFANAAAVYAAGTFAAATEVLVVYLDTTVGNAVVYYDADGEAGGANGSIIASLTGITTAAGIATAFAPGSVTFF